MVSVSGLSYGHAKVGLQETYSSHYRCFHGPSLKPPHIHLSCFFHCCVKILCKISLGTIFSWSVHPLMASRLTIVTRAAMNMNVSQTQEDVEVGGALLGRGFLQRNARERGKDAEKN